MTEPHAIDRDDVMAWLDGELPPARAAEVSAHVSACTSCQALADDLRQVSARLQAWDIEAPPARGGLPRALEDALRPAPTPVTGESGRRGLAGWLGLTWPQWGVATAALASIALVAIVWNPMTERAGPVPAFERASADRATEPGAAPPADSPSPARTLEETVPAPVAAPAVTPAAPASTVPPAAPTMPVPAPPAQAPPPAVGTPLPAPPPPVGVAARADERAVVVSGGVAGGIAGNAAAAEMREAEPAAMARATSLTLSVDDVASARARLEALVAETGGALESNPMSDAQGLAFGGGGRSRTAGRGGGAAGETVTLLVPAAEVDEVLAGVRALGTVIDPIESATDMSAQMKAAVDDVAAARAVQSEAAAAASAAPPGSAAAAAAARQLEDARRETVRLETVARDLETRAALVRVTIRLVRGGAAG